MRCGWQEVRTRLKASQGDGSGAMLSSTVTSPVLRDTTRARTRNGHIWIPLVYKSKCCCTHMVNICQSFGMKGMRKRWNEKKNGIPSGAVGCWLLAVGCWLLYVRAAVRVRGARLLLNYLIQGQFPPAIATCHNVDPLMIVALSYPTESIFSG